MIVHHKESMNDIQNKKLNRKATSHKVKHKLKRDGHSAD